MHLSDAQREKLCEMTNLAYLEIRRLAETGRLEQAVDLADVFHNLLNDMWDDRFSLMDFRHDFLIGYHRKYHEPTTGDYVALVDQIIQLDNPDQPDP
jgi:hypothetical protein